MNGKIKDGGPAFPSLDFMTPDRVATNQPGMTLRDYAEIHFASAWAVALGTSDMTEGREARTAEANRLGRIQADEFIAAREVLE